MREILFRGKDVRGQWYYGLLAHVNGGWYISNKAGIATAYEVREETIGQYTGLTDKNGKKIFEGDIIRGLDGGIINTPRIVRWDEHHFAFKCPLVNEHWAFGRNDCPLCLIQEIAEVIGNIHDNPELLGGADNDKD